MYLNLHHDVMFLGGHNIMLNFGLYIIESIPSMSRPHWVDTRQSPIGLDLTLIYGYVGTIY